MVPRTPVRHRARRAVAELSAGRPRHHARGAARASGCSRSTRPPTGRPGRSRGLADLRRARRRAAGRAARRPGRASSWRPARTSGPAEEFAALAAGAGAPPPVREDPWRRTSGMHKVRTRRQLAYVAELWYARDEIARDRTGRRPDPARRRDHRAGHRGAIRIARHLPDPGVPAPPGAPLRRGVVPGSHGAAPSGNPSCRRCTARARDRRRPGCGRPRTRWPPSGWPGARGAHRPGRRARAAGGEPAHARPRAPARLATARAAQPGAVDAALAGYGARPWQRRLTLPALAWPWPLTPPC